MKIIEIKTHSGNRQKTAEEVKAELRKHGVNMAELTSQMLRHLRKRDTMIILCQ